MQKAGNGCQLLFGEIVSGVPQGSILGPALFLLFLAEVEEKIRPDVVAASMWVKENKIENASIKDKVQYNLEETKNCNFSKTIS